MTTAALWVTTLWTCSPIHKRLVTTLCTSFQTPISTYFSEMPLFIISWGDLQKFSIEKINLGIIEKLSISKNVHPISSDKLNWKHCSKNKKESLSNPRRIWNCLWKQCTKLCSNTRRTSWIVKFDHSFLSRKTWF